MTNRFRILKKPNQLLIAYSIEKKNKFQKCNFWSLKSKILKKKNNHLFYARLDLFLCFSVIWVSRYFCVYIYRQVYDVCAWFMFAHVRIGYLLCAMCRKKFPSQRAACARLKNKKTTTKNDGLQRWKFYVHQKKIKK